MQPITISTTINAPVEHVWKAWTTPEDITKWCYASEDWMCPGAENDLRVDGKFKTIMSARDGSASFDFEGIYTEVDNNKHIAYTISDGRKVSISFETTPEGTKVVETFDPENENSEELQRSGWQAILENFKKYAESK